VKHITASGNVYFTYPHRTRHSYQWTQAEVAKLNNGESFEVNLGGERCMMLAPSSIRHSNSGHSESDPPTEELCNCGGVLVFDDETGRASCPDCGSREAYTTPALALKRKKCPDR
jgi:hypothetical protein